jgi:hypothetical protein
MSLFTPAVGKGRSRCHHYVGGNVHDTPADRGTGCPGPRALPCWASGTHAGYSTA